MSAAVKLFGVDEPVAPRRILAARAPIAELDESDLRQIRCGGVENVRAVFTVVRKRRFRQATDPVQPMLAPRSLSHEAARDSRSPEEPTKESACIS